MQWDRSTCAQLDSRAVADLLKVYCLQRKCNCVPAAHAQSVGSSRGATTPAASRQQM
jgi:hypothetical protein